MSLETYPQILNALSDSEAGASLKNTYRWEKQFRNGESNKKWCETIGMSGQVFTHGDLFYHLGETFLKYEDGRFTEEEQQTFLLGIALHDVGEAKINGAKYVGDKVAGTKTAKDEIKEVKVAYKVIGSLNLPEDLKGKMLDAYKKVVEGGDPKLYQAFKALEKAEYIITAMKVYQNSKRMREQGRHPIKHEIPLVGRVLVKDLPRALDVTPEFPNSIGKMFKNAIPLIDEMFAYTLPWLESGVTWGFAPKDDHKALADAFRTKWEAFKSTQ